MPRFFLHLRDSTDEVLDPEGLELPADAVAQTALTSARDCMAADVIKGKLDLHFRIDVHDESGAIVHSVSFAEAVAIVGP